MLCLFLAAHSFLFVPSKTEKWYSDLDMCPVGQPAESGCKGLERKSAFHNKNSKKNCYKLYWLLSALIMSFWWSISALDFILLGGADISWNTSYFKSFWVWYQVFKYYLIQFCRLLVSSGGGSLFNFHYHWKFKRASNLQLVSPKL